ncbi:tRNA (adenosine(37)-N6)-threonylcarbamoyltransferase complex ATPase subunit type 1 TsaE [Candidatus Vallotia cooleyia]|uniref:tRNA (adenosine(37)-N6)-threonylcarbamoyltransferase complex ATPase subunit type 1 TsaE n=1 Tax=Candidatus Vallotiella adelgis TaxID=1177211 RepID=UPI001D020CCE|nr:tRNA (adenosine(37)-N6)-threonylcarbamoyltransferase complex ATPase subunit type 1 TsaE [Candidatus Vallotia cooleyia]UDG82151.1 tRNA threonylcarbamoyladenosine biosynthesis protein TsaE [Candidatus Vallotia cooleyia]
MLLSKCLPHLLIERTFELQNERAAYKFGATLAKSIPKAMRASLRHSMQVHLVGNLGAGKTTLVRALLRALGYKQRVRSPTYTLIEPYTIENVDGKPLSIYHFDLYRFADPREWDDAGFREYFDIGALCLIEWPQRAGSLLNMPDLKLNLVVQGEGRNLTAGAYSATGKKCLLDAHQTAELS